jgi:hypothetical protein
LSLEGKIIEKMRLNWNSALETGVLVGEVKLVIELQF